MHAMKSKHYTFSSHLEKKGVEFVALVYVYAYC